MKRMIFAAATLFASLMLASVPALADGYTNTFNVSNATDFMNALSDINDDIGANDTYLITLTDSFAYSGESFKHGAVTIEGNGNTISGVSSFHLTANSGAVVNLNNVTIQGVTNGDTEGIFYVQSGTTLNLNNGATLKDHVGNNYLGGGVTVEGGTLNMNDGSTIDNCSISGGSVCYGGGVAVFKNGIFNMYGGTIKNCSATTVNDGSMGTIGYVVFYDQSSGWIGEDVYATEETPTGAGGGVFVCGATFNMEGGSIESCSASMNGGGVALATSYYATYYIKYKNGVEGMFDSKLTMGSNAAISGCTAAYWGGGIFAGGRYVYAAPIGTYSNSLGKMSEPGINISGGTISGNSAKVGGGVLLDMLQVNCGVEIKNAEITDNNAESNGAGICFLKGGNETTGYTGNEMISTTVTGNTIVDEAEDVSNRGAGVYYDASSKLYISGRMNIADNKYNDIQNNLNILSTDYPVYVDGSLAGSQIGISDPTLWGDNLSDAEATVSAAKLTSGYAANNSGVNPSQYFTSDHNTWYADYSEDKAEVRLVRRTEPTIVVLPVTTDESAPGAYSDAGYYNTANGNTADADALGVVRFSTYVENNNIVTIDEIGTELKTGDNEWKTVSSKTPLMTNASFTFSVDVRNIPQPEWNTPITGKSYAKSGASTFYSINDPDISIRVNDNLKWLGSENSYGGEKYGGSDAANKAVVNSIVNSSTGGGN